jgi:glucosamine-6-phosphate deaminase
MRVLRCASKEQLAYDAAVAGADRIREALHKKGKATIVLAAGMSQAPMLEFLVHENLDWGRVTAFHSDEFVGIRADEPGSFRKFLKDRFVEWVGLRAFNPIFGERNPITELKRLNRQIGWMKIDVAFTGIGENGHLAFNDPPADFRTESSFILAKLDRICRRQQVKEGWFGTVDQVPAKAITMSIPRLMTAESIICTVPDKRKAKAVKAAVQGVVTPKVPASILQQHPKATIFLEPESASMLSTTIRPLIHQAVLMSQVPGTLAPGVKRFHLLAIAPDWKKVPERDLAQFVQRAMGAGAATVTACGNGSFAVELALETEAVRRSVTSQGGKPSRQVPTSCFKLEELDEALFYFLEDSKELSRTTNAWVAVLIGDLSRRDRILEVLGDPGAFIDQHING